MFTTRGIAVDAFVSVDSGCPVTWEMADGHIQCQLGGQLDTGLTLVLTLESLENLLSTGAEILRETRMPVAVGE